MNNTVPEKVRLVRKPFLAAGILALILAILVALVTFKEDLFIDVLHSMGWRKGVNSNACVGNLRHIDGAKDQYALEYGGTNGTFYTWYQLSFFVRDISNKMICPSAQRRRTVTPDFCYSIEPLGSNPTCRIRGLKGRHSLENR